MDSLNVSLEQLAKIQQTLLNSGKDDVEFISKSFISLKISDSREVKVTPVAHFIPGSHSVLEGSNVRCAHITPCNKHTPSISDECMPHTSTDSSLSRH